MIIGRLERDWEWNYGISFRIGLGFGIWCFKVRSYKAEHSNACTAFADEIQHPNERVLAQEILAGARVAGDFSLGFDHSQVVSMTNRLISAGKAWTTPTKGSGFYLFWDTRGIRNILPSF